MTTSMKSFCMAAAVAGMLGGTSIRMQAQPVSGNGSGSSFIATGTGAGAAALGAHPKTAKHACKGLNSCKGQGADHKNSCKGKGSCATDGSKPPMPKM